MGPTIRPAQFEDVFQIERTLLDAARLAEFPVPPVERPYAVQKLMDLVAVKLIWVAATEDNTVVGCIVLSHHVWPWNRQHWHLVNDHFWVDPQYRKFGTAAKCPGPRQASVPGLFFRGHRRRPERPLCQNAGFHV
jgi:hypothetical protein